MIVWRNGFTYFSNIFVLSFALADFLTVSGQVKQFRILATASCGLGVISTVWYCIQIRENTLCKIAIEGEAAFKKARGKAEDKSEKKAGKKACDRMKEAQFYIFGCVYMFARVAMNVTATIMPLYLKQVSKFTAPAGMDTPIALASVPLTAYISSFLFSVFLQNWIT